MNLSSTSSTLVYRTATVEGIRIFYREAGRPGAPTILMLHGFPSSSRMYAGLIPLLADCYHIIAPDYPGFGQSEAPPADAFTYTFDHLATIVDSLLGQLGISRFSLLQQDYGGPIGMRLAVRRPARIEAIIVQNAVSHEEGLGPLWKSRRLYWADRKQYEGKVMPDLLSLEVARQRHLGSSPNPFRYDPSQWMDEVAAMRRAGQYRIQADLFHDYGSNVAAYAEWQAWLKRYQPPLLVTWGRYDLSFSVAGAEAYRRDVPDAEIHILDAGHFPLEERLDDIAILIRGFLGRRLINCQPRESPWS